ncbi:hypothetical protein AVEN_119616-1 [Araneus ventricosus]|uniref:Uncharacterized protein n=1 Tax=Araneus ventricosus TaxID=182803 RepID=A0A4Y2RL44_ARAVE|nr:hypothetical protein AVEN_119616-1 [Araneus ventricosus]
MACQGGGDMDAQDPLLGLHVHRSLQSCDFLLWVALYHSFATCGHAAEDLMARSLSSVKPAMHTPEDLIAQIVFMKPVPSTGRIS